MKRLIIEDTEHYRKARMFMTTLPSESRDSWHRSWGNLCYKANMKNDLGKPLDYHIHVFTDFVEHSFYWVWHTAKEETIMNGGLILHGFEEAFSVEINPSQCPHWSIHT